jgi:hypothetical protein
MRKMTGHFKKKKADSDTRTIEEIMTALDLSTACSMLINQVAHCPDSSGRPMDSLTRKYLQNALRDEIPLSQRGEAKGSMSGIPISPLNLSGPDGHGTSNRTLTRRQSRSSQIMSSVSQRSGCTTLTLIVVTCSGEPEASFEASYGASSGAAQKPVSAAF